LQELNRLRKAALAFGFLDLLKGVADMLERECTLLPDTAPYCMQQEIKLPYESKKYYL